MTNKQPTGIGEIEKQFEEMNRKCNEAYGCGKFPPEVWKFIESKLKITRREAVEDFVNYIEDYFAEDFSYIRYEIEEYLARQPQ